MWTQIKLLLQEQSGLGLHFLLQILQTHISRPQNTQTTLIVIGALRVKPFKEYSNQLPLLFLNAATRGSLSFSLLSSPIALFRASSDESANKIFSMPPVQDSCTK